MTMCSPPSTSLTPLTLVLLAQGADMAPQLHQAGPWPIASGSKARLPPWAPCLSSSCLSPVGPLLLQEEVLAGWFPHLPVGPPRCCPLARTLSPHVLTESLREDQERQYPHFTESTQGHKTSKWKYLALRIIWLSFYYSIALHPVR